MRMAYVKVWKQVVEEHEVYSFEELPEEVQDELVEKACNEEDVDFWWFAEDAKSCFDDIANMIHGKVSGYCYDLCGRSYTKISVNWGEEADLSGVRAMAYIWNNWIEPYLTPKTYYYGGAIRIDGKQPKRKSNILPKTLEYAWDCPITGWCYDYVLVEAYKDFVNDLRKNLSLTVEDFVDDYLAEHMTDEVIKEAEWRSSKDYHKEDLMERDTLYFEDGTEADVA